MRPGWYRDPQAPATTLRWWDGTAWDARTLPAPRPADAPKHAGANAAVGRFMVVAQSVLPVLETAVLGWAAVPFVRDLWPWLRAVADADGGSLPAPPTSFAFVLLASVLGLVGWVPLALELMWTYRVASTAKALGLPAVRDPLWAVVSWFIPVVEWWFPYTAVRDSLPPGHPARRTVVWWWGAYLACVAGPVLGIAAAFAGVGALVVVVVLVAIVSVVMAVNGIRMTRAIDATHRELLAARRGAAGSGPGGAGSAAGVAALEATPAGAAAS